MNYRIKYFFLMSFLFVQMITYAQSDNVFSIEKDMMVLRLKNKYSQMQMDSISQLFALPIISIDSLFKFQNIGKLGIEGWKLKQISNSTAVMVRSMNDILNTVDWSKTPILFSQANRSANGGTPGYPEDVTYGKNKFKQKITVSKSGNDSAIFWVPETKLYKTVYLSGNFNDWSLYGTPMIKTDSGWVAKVKLQPGKYFYKFIVDGKWIDDKYNELKEDDGHEGYNSTYFQSNYSFSLPGYKKANKVLLSGSFNNWDEKELKMQPSSDGWAISMYLMEGLHTYKFIIDGKWIQDPLNSRSRPDGEGSVNSVIGFGNPVTFKLKGFETARQVILSGSFNNWRTAELSMRRSIDGWELDYQLPSGNYEYKFIVDGNWITDPENQITVGANETKNSVLIVNPDFTFRIKNLPNVKEVLLSGTFNNWMEPGYKMIFQNGEWIFPIRLKPGKYIYKIVVDGTWMLDPDNKIWEENEFGNGNSVLWIESESLN